MKKTIILLLLSIVIQFKSTAQTEINHTYTKTEGPDKNPLKGWNSGWWDSYDIASVGFQYLKWKDFEPTNGNFNFDAVEDVINRPGSTGRHVILRLYADWFGANQTSDAGPSWLYNDLGVARLQSGGKYITDYNNTNYISQAIEAIEALADRYNDDPRIYAIQLGVLGYWGEWHTFSYDDPNFDISETARTQIISAYKSNFSNKQLMGRYPWRDPLSSTGGIGFHNDFFVPNNGHSDEFDDAIDQGNKWRQGPVGGEVPPIDNSEEFMTALYETPKGMSMIETGHYSTMKVGSDERPCANNSNSQRCQGFMAMHRKMGYNFQIESALFAERLANSDNLSVTITISNIGVAPLYYDWDVQFALVDQNNLPVQVFDKTYDLTTIVDNSSKTITLSSALNVSVGDYRLAIRLIQPDADTPKNAPWKLDARNTYILFSNEMTVIDGQWNANNALVGGWSILGDVTVQDATLGVTTFDPLENAINIYPNPSNKHLTILDKNNIGLNEVQFIDMTGRIIQKTYIESLTNNTKTIDISHLSAGVYNLILNADAGKVQKRFVKQ
ncbi:DUF4832 domain-containing protein [Aquimarina sp. 2201CG14-23]|uniref:DUF4832 domain-containing protein n=1 Tax=Aquimarina mycalae TaxID=3040073 RepID=UPI0024781730|nr:DUF4832 domain-containing protein [Aquimarina sp. 2201CG14-23]MDH7445931.1 DUF4832 domain-containing protein [Aquimarina sp. 2201CG14-23]